MCIHRLAVCLSLPNLMENVLRQCVLLLFAEKQQRYPIPNNVNAHNQQQKKNVTKKESNQNQQFQVRCEEKRGKNKASEMT